MSDPKLEADIAAIILKYQADPLLAVKSILGLQPIKDGLFLLRQRETWDKPAPDSSNAR